MPNVVIAVLASLAQNGAVGADIVEGAITHYGIDPARVDPYIV
jgi:pyruvate dehydrogenase complex dehydrogenase (E1) component